jgi:integrase
MCSPYRTKNSANYRVRKRVPADLTKVIGKTAIIKSLRTSDPKEAKRRAPLVCAEIDKILLDARRSLSMGAYEVETLKADYFRKRTDAILEQAQIQQWQPEDFEAATISTEDTVESIPPRNLTSEEFREWQASQASSWGFKAIENTLRKRNLSPTPNIAHHLGKEIYKVELAAHKEAHARMYGNPRWHSPLYANLPLESSETLLELFNLYAKSEGLPEKTVDSWRTYVSRANKFFKGKPAAHISDQDVRAFSEALRQSDKKLNPAGRVLAVKTINDNYIASLSAVWKWAIKAKKLTDDPTKGVRVKARATESLPKQGYTREEVATILRATRHSEGTKTNPEMANVRRWVPWLCAFTGARVSEILWLKREDIGFTEGIAYLSIYPDTKGGARSIKNTSSIRHTPLHPAIIDEGFLDYWKALPQGEEYLFPGNWADKNGDRAKTPANRLREWLKTKALPNAKWERLSPNHSFRHWLASECRIAKIDGDYARVIAGHSHKDDHGRYGPADTPTLFNELKAIPSPL